jgi:hypothetical protein
MMLRSVVVACLMLLSASSRALGDSASWTAPEGMAATDDEQAWRLFIALNWPASPTGTADRCAAFGADRSVVWESWKNSNQIFLSSGADPGPWEDARGGLSAETGESRFEAIPPASLPNLRHIVAGRMVPVTGPRRQASKLIEVRMNRTSFEYIRASGLYSLEGQLRLLSSGQEARFPRGAIQIKASWRPIAPGQRGRYHTLMLTRADGSQTLYGLTALNIALKDRPQWLWASFEHEDNAQRAGGDGWHLPSRDTAACGSERADCGAAPRTIGLEGTVWEHYRLRGTMSAYVDDAGKPQLLANSELEAGLQHSSSCITCHARASIGLSAGEVMRLPVFQIPSPDVDHALDGASEARASDTRTARRGYVGLPDPAWFGAGDASATPLTALDFVWSLSRAAARTEAPLATSNRGTP